MARRFDACMKAGSLVKVQKDPAVIAAFLREAETDLETAGKSFREGNDKWAIKQGHRSMQNAFRALLAMKGVEAKGIDCMKYAMDELYVREEVLSLSILENFEVGREIAKGNDCLCVYDKDDVEEILAATRMLLEKATELAKEG
jgi:uncharacterized protein (UPF0332 family)